MAIDFNKAKEELDKLAQEAGRVIHDAIDKTGDGLNDGAAHAENSLADGLNKIASSIDDVTEGTPLKDLGDKIGLEGRELASKLDKDADDHLADENSIGE